MQYIKGQVYRITLQPKNKTRCVAKLIHMYTRKTNLWWPTLRTYKQANKQLSKKKFKYRKIYKTFPKCKSQNYKKK